MYFYLCCVNISLILNSFYNTAFFDKKVSLFNVYAIRVGLNNAATSRILVNPAVILILHTNVHLNFYLFCVNVSSVLNTFHRISLSYKSICYFNLFHSGTESQSASLP